MAETKQAASLMSIEELKQKLGVSDAVFEGTKAANGWKSGRPLCRRPSSNVPKIR